jgi:ribonuclease H / adenosylcobalamin/alpha-ribazole phosphatase
MTTTILLVRHAAHVELGTTLSGRRRDVALCVEGLEQAAILADLLGTASIAAIYSSPRERAWYTAREIAEPHGLKPIILDDLDEVDFGEWTGRSFAELDSLAEWQRWNSARATARAPGGESMAGAVSRSSSVLAGLVLDHDGETIVAVSHCDIIRGIIAHHLGLGLDHLLRFEVDPASVSRLTLGAWGARIISVNERLYQ